MKIEENRSLGYWFFFYLQNKQFISENLLLFNIWYIIFITKSINFFFVLVSISLFLYTPISIAMQTEKFYQRRTQPIPPIFNTMLKPVIPQFYVVPCIIRISNRIFYILTEDSLKHIPETYSYYFFLKKKCSNQHNF